jgi:hypothetical protein
MSSVADVTQGIALGAQRVQIDIPVSIAPETLSDPTRHIYLVINGIQYAQSTGAYYEIYLDLPTGTPPGLPTSLFFVGNLGFFALPSVSYAQRFDISDLFRRQLQLGLANVNVAHLTLVLQGVPPTPGGTVTMVEGANAQLSGAAVTDTLSTTPPP